MEKIEKTLKSNLKHKIKITQGLLVIFLLTGNITFAEQPMEAETIREGSTAINITINNYPEEKGLELGTNGFSRGLGSITTGTNNIAIGKDAIATGNNEDKDTVKAKIQENESKLNEIKTQENKVREVVTELEKLKKRNQDVIDAANRVDALNKSKANLLNEYNRLKEIREELERNSAEKLREHEEKITDLNSKLSGVANLGTFDIANDTELTEKANQFKNQVEVNNSLNLSVDFYKDYINSYYKALGNLRKNEVIKSKEYEFDANPTEKNTIQNGNYYKGNVYENLPIKFRVGYYSANFLMGIDFYGVAKSTLSFSNRQNGTSSEIYKNYSAYINDSDFERIGLNVSTDKPTGNVRKINIDTDIITDDELENTKMNIEKITNIFNKASESLDDKYLSSKEKKYIINTNNLVKEIYLLEYEIANLQWKYETQGKETQFLNQKDKKLKELEIKKHLAEKIGIINNTFKTTLDYKNKNFDFLGLSNEEKEKYLIEEEGKYYSLMGYRKKQDDDWNKANIDDIKERNKITTAKLTADLEAALGINREEIERINQNIANAKNEENRALNNYNNLTISEKDLLLAREYENIVRMIREKETQLNNANERLRVLKEQLTLNDFTEGENAIAFGTNNLASGTSSIAMGTSNISTKEKTISIGFENIITGENSVALGQSNTITGSKSIAIGYGHTISGNNSGAFGDPHTIYGSGSYALGNNITIGENGNADKGKDVFVLGSDITTTNNNAIILGKGSTGVDNALSIGSSGNERKIVNVADGLISNTSKEAVNGSQLFALANGDLTNINVAAWKNKLGINSSNSGNSSGVPINNVVVYNNDRTEVNLGTVLKDKYNIPEKKVKASRIEGDFYVPNLTDDEKREILENFKESNPDKDLSHLNINDNVDRFGTLLIDNNNWISHHNTLSNSSLASAAGISNAGYDRYNKNKIEKELGKGHENGVKITNLADGEVSVNSTDAINGRVLHSIKSEIDNKANINGNNIVKVKDKEDFRNAIEVYSKTEIENKIQNITAGTVDLTGEITETEERGVKGKVIDKHLKENYVHKNDLSELGNTVKANTERINELEGRIKESTALSTALSSIEYPNIRPGEVGVGAGVSSFQGKQGVAIGASYMPKEDLLLSMKYAGLTNNRFRGAVSGSISYKFRLHN